MPMSRRQNKRKKVLESKDFQSKKSCTDNEENSTEYEKQREEYSGDGVPITTKVDSDWPEQEPHCFGISKGKDVEISDPDINISYQQTQKNISTLQIGEKNPTLQTGKSIPILNDLSPSNTHNGSLLSELDENVSQYEDNRILCQGKAVPVFNSSVDVTGCCDPDGTLNSCPANKKTDPIEADTKINLNDRVGIVNDVHKIPSQYDSKCVELDMIDKTHSNNILKKESDKDISRDIDLVEHDNKNVNEQKDAVPFLSSQREKQKQFKPPFVLELTQATLNDATFSQPQAKPNMFKPPGGDNKHTYDETVDGNEDFDTNLKEDRWNRELANSNRDGQQDIDVVQACTHLETIGRETQATQDFNSDTACQSSLEPRKQDDVKVIDMKYPPDADLQSFLPRNEGIVCPDISKEENGISQSSSSDKHENPTREETCVVNHELICNLENQNKNHEKCATETYLSKTKCVVTDNYVNDISDDKHGIPVVDGHNKKVIVDSHSGKTNPLILNASDVSENIILNKEQNKVEQSTENESIELPFTKGYPLFQAQEFAVDDTRAFENQPRETAHEFKCVSNVIDISKDNNLMPPNTRTDKDNIEQPEDKYLDSLGLTNYTPEQNAKSEINIPNDGQCRTRIERNACIKTANALKENMIGGNSRQVESTDSSKMSDNTSKRCSEIGVRDTKQTPLSQGFFVTETLTQPGYPSTYPSTLTWIDEEDDEEISGKSLTSTVKQLTPLSDIMLEFATLEKAGLNDLSSGNLDDIILSKKENTLNSPILRKQPNSPKALCEHIFEPPVTSDIGLRTNDAEFSSNTKNVGVDSSSISKDRRDDVLSLDQVSYKNHNPNNHLAKTENCTENESIVIDEQIFGSKDVVVSTNLDCCLSNERKDSKTKMTNEKISLFYPPKRDVHPTEPTATYQTPDLTDSQLCDVLAEEDFECEFDQAQNHVRCELAKKRSEGETLVATLLRELQTINKQVLRLKREIDTAKMKMA